MSQYPPYGGQPPGPYGEPQQPEPHHPGYPQQPPSQPQQPGWPQQPPTQPQQPTQPQPQYPQQPPSQAPGQGQGWPQQPPTAAQPQTAWAPQSPVATPSPYGGYPQQPGTSSSSSGNRMALGIALVVVVVAAVVGGFFVVSDDDGGSTADSTTTTSAGPPIIPTPGGGGGGSDDEDDDESSTTTEPTEDLPADAVAADDNGDLPEDVMIHFVDALNAGDCEAAMGDLTDNALTEDGYSDRAEAVADCQSSIGGDSLGLVLDDVTLVDVLAEDHVVLAADMTSGGETTSDEWFLVVDAGLWKLDGIV